MTDTKNLKLSISVKFFTAPAPVGEILNEMKRIGFHSKADTLFGRLLEKACLKRYNLGFDEANKLEKDPAFQAALEQVEDKYPDAVLNPKFNTGSETQVNFQIGKIWER